MAMVFILLYAAIMGLGMFIYRSYEVKAHPQRYADFTQFYVNVVVPISIGTISFLVVTEILKYPEIPLFVSDKILFYALSLAASICFMGTGMHLTGKVLSPQIEKSHRAYKINRFYHIYLGHILPYAGFSMFVLSISLLALKHPANSSENSLFYIMAGSILGFFSLNVVKKTKEITRIFKPMLFVFILLYLILAAPYTILMLYSPVALFITSMAIVIFALLLGEIWLKMLKKIPRH